MSYGLAPLVKDSMTHVRHQVAAFAAAIILALCAGFFMLASSAESALAANQVRAGSVSASGVETQANQAYGIVYVLNGGKFSSSHPTKVAAGATVKVSSIKKPVRAGYTFAGWYKNKACTVAANSVVGTASVANRALYAKWTPRTYKLTYVLSGGKNPKQVARTYTVGTIVKLPSPTRAGYTFMGWAFNSKNGIAHTYIPKAMYGNIKLYAKWQKHALVAHQGIASTPRNYVGNSIVAFNDAANKGFTLVETDVRFTKDNVPVLSHDEDIAVYDKGSDGRRSGYAYDVWIEDLTYYQLQNRYIAKKPRGALTTRFVKSADGTWTTEKAFKNVATFAEFLDLCKKRGLVPIIELKEGTRSQINRLMNEVDKRGMTYSVKWSSFDSVLLMYVKQRHPLSSFSVLTLNVTNSKISFAKRLAKGGSEVNISVKSTGVTKTAVARCKRAGIPMAVWTLKNEKYVKRYDSYISEFIVNGVTTSAMPTNV